MENDDDYYFDYLCEDVSKGDKARQGRRHSSLPGHLASPIYEGECFMLIRGDKKVFTCRRHKMLKKTFTELKVEKVLSEIEDDPYLYLSKWVDKNVFWNGRLTMVNLLDVAIPNWNVHLIHHQLPAIKGGIQTIDALTDHTRTIDYKIRSRLKLIQSEFVGMKKVEVLKDSICFKEIEMGFFRSFGDNLKVERDLTLIRRDGEWVSLPTTLLLGALDKKQSLFPLFLYWIICDANEKYKGFSMFQTGTELYKIWADIRPKLGQDYFAFISTWESLMVGWIVALPDDIGCTGLLNSQAADMNEILDKYKVRFDIHSVLPKGRSIEEICLYTEMTGMSKMFGFPTLVEGMLLDQLKEHGVENKYQFNYTTIHNIVGVSRRDFLINYHRIKGHYPKLTFCPEEIVYYVKRNKPIPERYLKKYAMWQTLRFDKNFNYDYAPDNLELLKDSACAPNLKAWGTMYDSCAFRYHYDKGPPPSSKVKPTLPTRTITAFLKGKPDQLKETMDAMEKGIYDEEDHMAVENGKELELKPKIGRSFTSQTPNQRLVQTSMEMNISNSIFPFVPEQSMTDSEIVCLRRILEQVGQLGQTSEIVVLDLKKWCIFQRHVPNSFLGEMYDELFGLKGIFQHSHSYFIDCNIFNNSRTNPPDYDAGGNPIPGPNFMNRFVGAFEGFHQKKWTGFGGSTVKYVGEICDVGTRIMCQGDNMIIVLSYREDQKPDQCRGKFINMLSLTFNETNHELKDKETWYSKYLHEYGKARVYKGCFISQGTKKASRCIPDINDGLFSIPSSFSTINTSTEAIARADCLPDSAFILNQILSANYAVRKGLRSNSDTVGLQALLMFPVDFGGIPISTYNSHAVRGHDDKVTLWISILKVLKVINPTLYRIVLGMWITSPAAPASSAKERTRLYEDIFSLNIRSLPSADHQIREMTLEFLRSDYVTNPVVTRLYKSAGSNSKEQLIEALDTMQFKFIPIAHELLSLSNAGILDCMQRKMTANKTIEEIVKYERQISLIELITESNLEYKAVLRSRMRPGRVNKDQSLIEEADCPTALAQVLREKSWGPNIIGVTKPIYQHQVVLKEIDSANDDERSRSIAIQLSDQFVNEPDTYLFYYGPCQPYIGSITKEKVKRSTIDAVIKNSYLRAGLKLEKLKSWLQLLQFENLIMVVDLLIKEKMDMIDLPEGTDDLKDMSGLITSGNIFHRFLTNVESSYAMLNCTIGCTTHFSQSSNRLSSMTAGGKDYTIFYQMIYVGNMSLLMNLNNITKNCGFEYVAVLDCDNCSQLVEPVSFDLTGPPHLYGAQSLATDQSYFEPVVQVPDIRLVMSIEVGRKYALTVDEEYQHYHCRSCGGEKLSTRQRDTVSLNDLRQLDLKVIFHTMLLYSQHCNDLRDNTANCVMESLNTSKSFMSVAMDILNSGLISHVIQILDYKATEHTMLTRPEGLSILLSRAIPSYWRNNYDEIAEDGFARFYREDHDNPSIRKAVQHYITHKRTEGRTLSSILRKADFNFREGRLTYCLKLLGITRRVVPISREAVISAWRASKRPDVVDLVISPPPRIHRTNNISYPFLQYIAYTQARGNEEGCGVLDLPEASFLSRPLGNISSAANKYIEILEMIHALLEFKNDIRTLYCFAEGSGGTLDALAQIFALCTFSYNSWMIPSIDLRFDITDHTPPATTNSGLRGSSRFRNLQLLAHGQTDIKTPEFIQKMRSAMQQNPPFIVTMDAESEKLGTNLDFIMILLPVIMEYHPEVIIFKLFLQFDFRHLINTPGYEWVLIKPVSSNPCGPEIFLVLRKSIPSSLEKTWKMLKAAEDSVVTWMMKSHKLSDLSLQSYYSLSQEVCRCLRSMYVTEEEEPALILFSRYDEGISSGSFCSLHCKRFMVHVGEALDRIHASRDDKNVYVVVRRAGTDEVCKRLCMDVAYLLIYFSCRRSLPNTLVRLTSIIVDDNFRAFRARKEPLFRVTTPGDGNFPHNWGDMKMYMRDHSRSIHCTCRYPMERAWVTDTDLSYSLIEVIAKNLLDAGLITSLPLAEG